MSKFLNSSYLSTHSASECDFEGGSCGWYELTLRDGFDWVRGSSEEVPPHYYGHPPPLDHTTNSTEGKDAYVQCAAMSNMHLPSFITDIRTEI